jgi:hypothetical protein
MRTTFQGAVDKAGGGMKAVALGFLVVVVMLALFMMVCTAFDANYKGDGLIDLSGYTDIEWVASPCLKALFGGLFFYGAYVGCEVMAVGLGAKALHPEAKGY